MKKKHYISLLRNTSHFTIPAISKANVKKRITFDDICGGRNALHLTMGCILIIEFHNPDTIYKLTENLHKT